MKRFNYALSHADIKALLCTLELMPSLGAAFTDDSIQQSINISCCMSASDKLLNHHTDFTPNEIRVMAASLSLAKMVLSNEVKASQADKALLKEHLFTINKLDPIFDAVFH